MSNSLHYSEQTSHSTFAQRSTEYRALTLTSPGTGPFTELVRLIEGESPDATLLEGAAEELEQRLHGADFLLHGILAILHRFPEPEDRSRDLLGAGLRRRLRSAVLGFKYWPEEPGTDDMCAWTESHQITFAAGAYLAGQLYPDEVFTNSGRTGREQMNRFRPRIERWLELRFRSGFSEWLSTAGYDEDLSPLFNLVEFAHDPKLVRSATMVVDAILLDVVLNQFRGTFGSTHGRSLEVHKKDGAMDAAGPLMWLIAGTNHPRPGSMSATLLATSTRYALPAVLAGIAADTERPEIENRQRMGIRLADAEQWGLGFKSLEDGMVYLSMEAYLHERTVGLTLRMLDEYNWWENRLFAPIAKRRGLIGFVRRIGLMRPLARLLAKDMTRTTREEVNTYTYRTPDYMLSCAQDYRAGYGGDRHHVWQATLGPRAVVFTTQPGATGRDDATDTPTYWTGSGTLPRAVQYKNVLICHYRINSSPGLYRTNRELFTHAWFPREQFHEVREESGWVLGRRGAAYVALWSQHPYEWRRDDADPAADAVPNELVVGGTSNIWICVCGREATHGTFDEFCRTVAGSSIALSGRGRRERVEIDLAPHGTVGFGWTGPLTVGGWEMPITSHTHGSPYPAVPGYRRYDNPYVSAEFPANAVRVRCNDETLSLNWRDQARSASSYA
ncbi:MAG: hypothetical protein ACOC2Y_07945 [Spirochaetota bacterium]